MRVLLVTTQVPFVQGGAEGQFDGLLRALRVEGHEVETLPLSNRFGPEWDRPGQTLLAARSLDVERLVGPVDVVVAMKFPGWLVRHSNKVVWLIHQERAAYDLWDQGFRRIPDGAAVRRLVKSADRLALSEARRVFSISNNVARRLTESVGIESKVLRPPIDDERFVPGESSERYFLVAGRIADLKRHDLAIRALRHCTERLVIVGRTQQPELTEDLRQLARDLDVAHRIVWCLDASDEDVVDLYRRARAVVFVPLDEDYGLITPEAMSCERPVITCRDSGGSLELVEHESTGLVVDAEPEMLGRAMKRLGEDPELARRLGREGGRRYRALGVRWPTVTRALLSEEECPHVRAANRAAACAAPRGVDVGRVGSGGAGTTLGAEKQAIVTETGAPPECLLG